MSASSSAIRMSAAIASSPYGFHLFGRLCHRSPGVAWKDQPHQRTLSPEEIIRRIPERYSAPMLLHDALDDRQSQSRALLARCHIGLGQPRAVFLGQPDAVIHDIDIDLVPEIVDHHADTALAALLAIL